MAYVPENTRESFEKAWALGADAVECDVHLSKDGEVVVIHDATLERTTDGRGRVRDHAWVQLRRLNAGRWFSERFAKERLWRLDDLARWARAKKGRSGGALQLIVEIKSSPDSPRRIPAAVVRILTAAKMTSRALVISFDPRAVRETKRLRPKLRTGLLFSKPLRGLEGRMTRLKADAVFPKHTLLTPSLLRHARRRGWFVGAWTVNDRREMRRVKDLGVDAVASNFPDRLARELK